MKVLNATHRVFNLMTDRGEIRQIQPGSLSEPMVATKNLILGAIRQGNQNEVGVILYNTYEQGIANSITGGQPYYYLSEEEAKNKLIDPTIDYKAGMQKTQIEEMKEVIVKLENEKANLQTEIDLLNQKLTELESEKSVDKSIEDKLIKSEESVNTLTNEIKTLESTIEGYKSTIMDKDAQIQTLTAEKQSLKERVDPLAEEVKQLREFKELAESKPSVDSNSEKLQSEVNNLKGILKQVVEDFELDWDETQSKFIKR